MAQFLHALTKKGSNPRHFGFTLAELLMATLIISIIMVALAPVITRRAHDNVAITVNQKQGLEIFATPGIYSFDVPIGINTLFLQGAGGGGGGGGATYVDKTAEFTTGTTWEVPRGVNQIKFTITGAGGGGGGGGGAPASMISCHSEDLRIIRGADSERDLCFNKYNAEWSDRQGGGCLNPNLILNREETCPTPTNCCWYATETLGYCQHGPGESGCKRYNCTESVGSRICGAYKNRDLGLTTNLYRLPSEAELKKVQLRFKDLVTHPSGGWDKGLNLCVAAWNNYMSLTSVPVCHILPTNTCIGSDNGTCSPYKVPSYDGKALAWVTYDPDTGTSGTQLEAYSTGEPLSIRCVREIWSYSNYSGAGGASGAQMVRTIFVLPKDTLTVSIGTGGNGGAAKANGAQGGTTQITHKRNGSTIGTYYVKGGFGGYGATESANGSAYANTSTTTPSGTCYAKYLKNGSWYEDTNCGTEGAPSYSGASGSSSRGGNGGRVRNTGTINDGGASSGGYLYVDNTRTAHTISTATEQRCAKGQNAGYLNANCKTNTSGSFDSAFSGFGGGGGLTPAWATGTEHFYGGGKGANGKINITYRVNLPGGGGGSASRVGGVNAEGKMYEIKYKVEEGSRVVVKIGAGGSGAAAGGDGVNGEATIVGDNHIVFLGGQGGKVATQSQKNSLLGGSGGNSGYINQDGNNTSNSLGLVIKSGVDVGYTISSSSFKGQKGRNGGLQKTSSTSSTDITDDIWKYGFSGGVGGSPFGIKKQETYIVPSVTCGGGISAIYGTKSDPNSYICTSGMLTGGKAKVHDPVNNEFGGSGGGGGGVIDTSLDLGDGSNGTSGYLRIRWNEAEQE